MKLRRFGTRLGLRWKLLSYFTMAGILPLTIGLWATYATSRTALLSSAGSALAQAAAHGAKRLHERASHDSLRIALCLRHPAVLAALVDAEAPMVALDEYFVVAQVPVIRASLYGLDGRLVGAAGAPDGPLRPVLDADIGAVSLHWSEADQLPLRHVRVDIADPAGARLGRIHAVLDASQMIEFGAGRTSAPHRRGWLADTEGRVLGGRAPVGVGQFIQESWRPALRRGSVGFERVPGRRGEAPGGRLLGLSPVKVAPDSALGLVVVMDTELEEAMTSSALLFGLILALTLVLSGFLLWSASFWSARIIQPIRILGAVVGAVSEGDLGQRVQIKTGDELEALAQGYNQMIQTLQEYHALLRQRIERGEEELEKKRKELATSEEERELSSEELGLLYAVSQAILRASDLSQTLQSLVDSALIIFNVERTYVLLCEGELLRGAAVAPAWGAEGPSPSISTQVSSAALVALKEERTVVVDDAPSSYSGDLFRHSAAAYVPIVAGPEAVGVLVLVAQAAVFSWEPRTLARARRVADQAAIAIANERLLDNLGERVEDLSTLYELEQVFASSLDLQRLLIQALELLELRLRYQRSAVVLKTEEAGTLGCVARRGMSGEEIESLMRPSSRSPVSRAMATGEPVVGSEGGLPPAMTLPLYAGGRVIGVLCVGLEDQREPGERDLRVLRLLAPLLAMALENARVHGSTYASEQRFRALFEVGRVLASTLDPEVVMERALEILSTHLGYGNTSILRFDPSRGLLYLAAQRGDKGTGIKELRLGEGICGHAAEIRKPILVPDVRDEPRYLSGATGTRTELAVPIAHADELLGVLDIESETPGALGREDCDVLMLFAAQMAVAIKNARLFHEREVALRASRDADRLKTQFLANTSHELRTPLTSIIGFSEVLIDGFAGELNAAQARCVGDVLSSGKHLLQLINRLLDLSRIESGKMEPAPEAIDMLELFDEVESTVSGLIRQKRLGWNPGVESDALQVFADRGMLKQVLLNLVGNALKFTPDEGRIDLVAARTSTADVQLYRSVVGPPPAGGLVTLTVVDTGIGISAADQEVIFAEFRQADGSYSREHQGSGLGLALSKRFVEINRGMIWVESQLGAGATFRVALPRIAAAPRPLRVALVSGDEGLGTRLGNALKGPGRTLTWLRRWDEKRDGAFDIVVLDLEEDSGVPASLAARVPLIVLSRRALSAEEKHALPANVEGLIAMEAGAEDQIVREVDRLDRQRNRA